MSSNDRSHYALVQAIVEKGTLRIDDTREGLVFDFAAKDGHYYSDRPPGTAFLAVPFYVLGKVLLSCFPFLHRWLTAGFFVTLLPVFMGTLGVLFLYLLSLRLGCSTGSSFILSFLYAFTTLNWKYASVLYSHVPSATLTLMMVWALFSLKGREWNVWGRIFLVGMGFGFLPLFEYPAVFFLGSAGIYVFYATLVWNKDPGKILMRMIAFCLGAGVGLFPLFLYNRYCFGSPFATSYTYHGTFEWSHSFQSTFSGNFFEGLSHLLFLPGTGGLFLTNSYLLLAPIGLIAGEWRRQRRLWEGLFLSGLFLAYLVLMSFHKTYFGGGAEDTRYIFIVAGFPLVLVGFFLDKVWEWQVEQRFKKRAIVVSAFLIFSGGVGLIHQAVRIMNFFGHEHFLRFGMIHPGKGGKVGRFHLYFRALFPGAPNILFYVLIALVCMTPVILLRSSLSPPQGKQNS